MPVGTHYSRKARASVYPIKAGNVLSPLESLKIRNDRIGGKSEHKLFIWVLRESVKRDETRWPKRRGVSVIFLWQPVESRLRRLYILEPIKKIQFESVVLYLRAGYRVVATGVSWHHKRQMDAKRFYKAIGII